jgi:hypothetical protein
MQFVAADLGLTMKGGAFRRSRAAGRFDGIDITLTLEPGPLPGPPTTDVETSDQTRSQAATGLLHERFDWTLRAVSHHRDVGAGWSITAGAGRSNSDADAEVLVMNDRDFDDTVTVHAASPDHARRVLTANVREVVLTLFEAGVEAEIRDEEIVLQPRDGARALAARLRDAAQASRMLQERLAELT